MKKITLKKFLALALVLAMTAGCIPAAFAETVTNTVSIFSLMDEEIERKVDGDVEVEDKTGVNVNAKNTSTAKVEVTGDVSSEGEGATAVSVYAKDDAEATVIVGGEVEAVSNLNEPVDDYGRARGIEANASGNGEVTVETGDVTTEGLSYNAVQVVVSNEATAEVTVGDIDASAEGLRVEADGGLADVTTGDIEAEATGVTVSMRGGEAEISTGEIQAAETGVQINIDNGTVNLTTGSVTAKNNAIRANLSGEWVQTELTAGEFAALDLGDPHGTHIADLGNGETRTIQSWSFDAANYRTETYGNETMYFKNEALPSFGTITMDINGSVTANNESGSAAALNVSTGSPVASGDVKVNVNGDISATAAGHDDAMGVAAHAGPDGSVDINVDGSISVVQNNGTAEGWGDNAAGIDVGTSGGHASVTVTGDVDVTSLLSGKRDNTVGVRATTTGADAEVDITVNGGITVSGENAIGISVSDKGYGEWGNTAPEVVPESDTRIAVFGDVNADDYGAYIEVRNDQDTLDLLVDGTLSGEKASVLLNEDTLADNITLTVWAVTPSEDGAIAQRESRTENEETGEITTTRTADKDFEKQIQYIIRVEQPEVGSVAAEGTSKYENYDVAREGDTVTLKVTVPDGYKLVDAFNGTDTKVPLLKDADGNFYLVVPRGGAVTLSVKLEKEESSGKKESSNNEEVPVIAVTPVDYTPEPAQEPAPEAEPEKMDDAQIAAAVEELLTKNGVLENSVVEVETDESGAKTVVISPETIEAGEESTVLQLTVPAEMLTQLADSDVQQIRMVSQSGGATVSLDVAAVLEAAADKQGAKLVMNIEENSESVQNALKAVPTGFTGKAGAVTVTARIEDAEGNVTVLDSSANITLTLNVEYEEGMKILFVDADGNVSETEAVWVEAADGVPGHWEVPFLGEGTYLPVVENK